MEFIAKSLNETKILAEKIANQLKGCETIVLNGDLGSGKTTLTKYLAKALGVEDNVVSPTFNILKSYEGSRFKIHHFDMYRIESEDELYEMGFEDILYDDGICIIEWNKAPINKDIIEIDIVKIDDTKRQFKVKGFSKWLD